MPRPKKINESALTKEEKDTLIKEKLLNEYNIKPKILLNDAEVSVLLRVTRGQLRSFRHKKMGPPYFKVGKSARYEYEDVRDYLESMKRK